MVEFQDKSRPGKKEGKENKAEIRKIMQMLFVKVKN